LRNFFHFFFGAGKGRFFWGFWHLIFLSGISAALCGASKLALVCVASLIGNPKKEICMSAIEERNGNGLGVAVEFLRNALSAAQIEGSRGRLDIFADLLVKASSEPTLAACLENLLQAVNASGDRLHAPLVARTMRVAASPDGPRILRWLREQARLATMLAATNDAALVAEALAEMELPPAGETGQAAVRRPYAVGIRAACESPLAHGADGKAGNATLFRRIDVLATNGAHMTLPYYSGNAVRGQMRDLLADHFLHALGLPADRSKPAVALWFFYALYSGGALEEKSDATKALKKQLGDNGSLRAEGIRAFRDNLPALSLLGCALGNRVLPGHVQVADLRPVCREWGTGETPVAELMTWEFLTRREDHENHAEHHGMIANTECLRAGTLLEGGVDMDACMPEIERSALGCGLRLLADRGMLGAENRRGLGRVNIELPNAPDGGCYEAWLAENKAAVIDYLDQIGAAVKPAEF
jgi:hypothetical protein